MKTDLAAVKKTSDDASGLLSASDILDGTAPSRIRADARAHMAMIEEKKPVMGENYGQNEGSRNGTCCNKPLSVKCCLLLTLALSEASLKNGYRG